MILFQKLDHSRITMGMIVITVWMMVAVYAIVHDQYIVRIAPEHFTVYHRPVPGVKNPALQAAVLALLASIGPGFALGISLAISCRVGRLPKARLRHALLGTAVVITIAEIISAGSGVLTYLIQVPIYPKAWYPVGLSLPLMVTQTIQITCYLASGFCSFILICIIPFLRAKWKRDQLTSSLLGPRPTNPLHQEGLKDHEQPRIAPNLNS